MTKLYDGQQCIGLAKPLRDGGLEVYDVTGAYIAKATSEAEAARVVIAARQEMTGSPQIVRRQKTKANQSTLI